MTVLSTHEREKAHETIIALVNEYVIGTAEPIRHEIKNYKIGVGEYRMKASSVSFLAPFQIDGAVLWVAFEAYLEDTSRFTTETQVHKQLKTKRRHLDTPASFATGDIVLAKLRLLVHDERLPFPMSVRLRRTMTEARIRAELGFGDDC